MDEYNLCEHQVATSDLGIVRASQYSESAVVYYLTNITRGNEWTGIDIGHINYVDAPNRSSRRTGGVGEVAKNYPHPWWRFEYPISFAVCLRQ